MGNINIEKVVQGTAGSGRRIKLTYSDKLRQELHHLPSTKSASDHHENGFSFVRFDGIDNGKAWTVLLIRTDEENLEREAAWSLLKGSAESKGPYFANAVNAVAASMYYGQTTFVAYSNETREVLSEIAESVTSPAFKEATDFSGRLEGKSWSVKLVCNHDMKAGVLISVDYLDKLKVNQGDQ